MGFHLLPGVGTPVPGWGIAPVGGVGMNLIAAASRSQSPAVVKHDVVGNYINAILCVDLMAPVASPA